MSDLGKVPGERGPRPSEEGKRKKGPDSDAFKEMMKVGKVREVDPEEQRKRKSRAEAEEELAAEQAAGPPLQQGLGAEPPPFFPQAAEGAPAPPQAGGVEGAPSQPPVYTPGVEQAPEPPQGSQGEETAPTQKKKKKKQAGVQEPNFVPKTETKTKKAEKGGKLESQTPKAPKATTTQAEEKPKLAPLKEELPTEEPKKKKAKEVAQEMEGVGKEPLAPGGWESTKELEKKDTPLAASVEVEAQTQGAPSAPPPAAQSPEPLAAPFAHLPPQVAQLFERMVGVMTVMHESGISETTLTLDNPQFERSVFYGAQITVTEYTSAPKEYNIEMTGNQQAVDLLNANVEELVAAFQAGKYNFKVNRIDISQQRAVGEVKRKEVTRVKRKQTKGGT